MQFHSSTHDNIKSGNALLIVLCSCGGLALCGIYLLAIITQHGIGVSYDSVQYIGAARNLLLGHGLGIFEGDASFRPMVNWPPLFPISLGVGGLFGIDPLSGARWLNCVCFGANILLVGLLVYKYSRSIPVALAATLMVLTARDLLETHSYAVSEPSFISLMLFSILLLQSYLDKGHRHMLWGASIISGLALLDRYAGMAIVWTGIAGIFILGKGTLRVRMRDCIIFTAIACLPIALWTFRTWLLYGTVTGRPPTVHRIGSDEIKAALLSISGWALPDRLPLAVKLGAPLATLFTMVAYSIYTLWRRRSEMSPKIDLGGSPRIAHLLVLAVIAYLALLIVSQLYLFPGIDLAEARILAPIHVLSICSLVSILFWTCAHLVRNKIIAVSLIGIVILLLSGRSVVKATPWAFARSKDGAGYTNERWKALEIWGVIKSLPLEAVIYSNGPDAISFIGGRSSCNIPNRIDRASLQKHVDYEHRLAKMRDGLSTKNGILIYFDSLASPLSLSKDELVTDLRLTRVFESPEASAYVKE